MWCTIWSEGLGGSNRQGERQCWSAWCRRYEFSAAVRDQDLAFSVLLWTTVFRARLTAMLGLGFTLRGSIFEPCLVKDLGFLFRGFKSLSFCQGLVLHVCEVYIPLLLNR